MNRSSVALVDDLEDFRNSLGALLSSHGIHVIPFASGPEFLVALDKSPMNSIGCALVDYRMPEMDGLQVLESVRRRKLQLPVILITGHATVDTAVRAFRLGACDVLEKTASEEKLITRVNLALASSARYQKMVDDRQFAQERINSLTPREREVLDLMVRGLKNRDIAKLLGISTKTLDIHRAKLMEKLEARTVADLVRYRLVEQADDVMRLPPIFG